MAKVINITNGQGTGNLINGSYDVEANVVGYDNTSIAPSNVEVIEGTNTYNFTIAANGTLTLHVTEEGTASGTPIVGATFIRCDSEGNTYGNSITTDSNGDAIFSNVPYDATSAPTIYFKQTASDGEHEFNADVQSTTLTTQTETLQIQNNIGALRTINLYDANYENLPVDGSLTFTNESE